MAREKGIERERVEREIKEGGESKTMREVSKEELVEALLFIAGKFLSVEEISSLTGIGIGGVRAILERLLEKYSARENAIKIIERDNFFKMDVRGEYTFLINKLAAGESEFSKAEQETLAVIAYKAPILQNIVIKIRGNKAYNHVKRFVEASLVTAKKSGRSYILGLSDSFYNYFSIDKVDKGSLAQKFENKFGKESEEEKFEVAENEIKSELEESEQT